MGWVGSGHRKWTRGQLCVCTLSVIAATRHFKLHPQPALLCVATCICADQFIAVLPIGERSIVVTESVSLSVCPSLRGPVRFSPNFLRMLPMAVARSSIG